MQFNRICDLARLSVILFHCLQFLLSFLLSKLTHLKRYLGNTMTVPNSLDFDQAQYFVWPNLVPKCGCSIDDNSSH